MRYITASSTTRNTRSYRGLNQRRWLGAKMDQWLSNLSPFETYLIAVPAIMLGSILFLGGIILLLGRRNKNDAETLEAIRKDLEKAGTEFSGGERTGRG
jgi:hypothetical protein